MVLGSNPHNPQLAPPGAGVPFWESLFYRAVVGPFLAGREDPALSRKRFVKLHEKIQLTYLSIPEKHRATLVLVPSQKGLENSSRYWSAAMILEHVVIVGRGMQVFITELSHGRLPTGEAKTADVKPLGTESSEVSYQAFEDFRLHLIPSLDRGVKDWHSPTTWKHPWFGQLTARKWFWVLGMHGGIHLKQMKAIARHFK